MSFLLPYLKNSESARIPEAKQYLTFMRAGDFCNISFDRGEEIFCIIHNTLTSFFLEIELKFFYEVWKYIQREMMHLDCFSTKTYVYFQFFFL